LTSSADKWAGPPFSTVLQEPFYRTRAWSRGASGSRLHRKSSAAACHLIGENLELCRAKSGIVLLSIDIFKALRRLAREPELRYRLISILPYRWELTRTCSICSTAALWSGRRRGHSPNIIARRTCPQRGGGTGWSAAAAPGRPVPFLLCRSGGDPAESGDSGSAS